MPRISINLDARTHIALKKLAGGTPLTSVIRTLILVEERRREAEWNKLQSRKMAKRDSSITSD